MAKRGIQPMAEEHVNVTPLIDVVMCLIIFFMVCGQMAKDELAGGNLTVPEARLGQEIEGQRDRIVINVLPFSGPLPENLAALDKSKEENQKAVEEFIGRQPPVIFVRGKQVDERTLVDQLRLETQHNRDLKVMIRADKVQHYEYVAPVLVCCARANIRSVNFSTTQLQTQ